MGYRFALLALIVGTNAFFAAAELALVSVRRSRLIELAAAGHVGAQAALSLLGRPERLLSTVQVGVTLASLGAGWAGEETLYRLLVHWLGPLATSAAAPVVHVFSFVLSFLALTFAMVVLGEVVPKNLAMERSDRFAVAVAPLLLLFHRAMQPFVFVLERSSTAVSRLLGRGRGKATAHSVEELKLIASSVRASGRMSQFEEEGLQRLLELREVSVREVMAPRNEVVALPIDASLEQVLRTLVEHGYTRVPVYEGRPEHVIGMLHSKDLLPVWQRQRAAAAPFDLRAVLRKPLVAPESKPLIQLLDEFRVGHAHLALVVDEFGTITGLVTLEDLLEQIFGEIEDEHDVRRPPPAPEAPVLELDGITPIRDLDTQYGLELPVDAGFETLAGFLLSRLGHIPAAGESVEAEGRRFTVLEMEGRRIARVRIERVQGGRGQTEASPENPGTGRGVHGGTP
ncbi:MAG: HlyC/CorC family transporter [Acidobacteria bacterium]|nr:HlyC/CorC family transporter [Acidobacteriota bacterium]